MRGHITRKTGKKDENGKDILLKNSWRIVLELGRDPATRKRKQQWVSVKGTRKEAEKRLAELIHQLDTGSFVKPGKTTVAEYLERWLADYAKPNLSPRTAEGYMSIVSQHLSPALGSIALTQLRPEHIQKYYTEKLSGGRCDGKGALNPTTVSHHHTCLHRALKMALKWGLINRNPADAVTPPRPQRSQMQTMNEDEVQTLLKTARGTSYYALFFLDLSTGMRRSELLALRWTDVDLILGEISVTRSLHHLRDGCVVFRAPKTAKGRRMIALPPSAILVMKEHRQKQALERAMLGIPLTDDDLVFSQLDGKPLLPDTVSHAWTKIVKRAGLKHFRLHDARHTHASLMLKQGIHPKIVQERLGHSSIQITLDTYSHVAPGLQEAAALRFDEMLKPRSEAVRENEAVQSPR